MDFLNSLRSIETFPLMENHLYTTPLITLGIYFSLIFLLPRVLPKKGYNIKYILIVWNGFLSIFSLAMLLGATIPFVSRVLENGLLNTVCIHGESLFVPSSMMMWGSLFIVSKFLELFDTIFTIIKHPEKPIIFLSWYHHSSVLIFTWFGWYLKFTPSFLCMPMNALIHVFMYYYYAAKELGYNPTWNRYLTSAQTLQMFIGLAINLIWAYIVYFTTIPCSCRNDTVMMWMSVVIYASYLYLFAQFYVKKYDKTEKKI